MIPLGTVLVPCLVERAPHINVIRLPSSIDIISLRSWSMLRQLEDIRSLYELLNTVRGSCTESTPYLFHERCRVVKPLWSHQLSLLIELYRDYMMGLGYNYPPYQKIDIRNRSCFDTTITIMPMYYSGEAATEYVDLMERHPTATCNDIAEMITKENATDDTRCRIVTLQVHVSLRPSAFSFFSLAPTPRVCCVTILKNLPSFASIEALLEDWERNSTASNNHHSISSLMDELVVSDPVTKSDTEVFGIHVPLKGYQMEHVLWMEQRERHSLDKLLWCKVTHDRQTNKDIFYSPILNFWRRGSAESYGGFLADSMGMGKTLTMLAVISRHRVPSTYNNLVVVPTSLIGQWKKEIESKTNLSVLVFHGPRRNKDPMYLSQFDIVLTSYGIVREDYELLQAYKWYRIVLDESHVIKNYNSVVSKRCRSLRARNRWLMSGTPMVTNFSDVCSQFGFLQLLTHRGFFRSMLNLTPYQYERSNRIDATKLKYLLSKMLRKRSQACISLPPLNTRTRYIQMTDDERKSYQETYTNALQHSSTLTRLVSIREFCSNGNIKSPSTNVQYIVDAAFDTTADICSICLDAMDNPVRTKCNHHFCQECLMQYIQVRRGTAPCPLCRALVKSTSILRVLAEAPVEEVAAPIIFRKILKIVADIQSMLAAAPTKKIILFTQYSNTMALYLQLLTKERILHSHIQGNMTQRRRSKAIDMFQDSSTCNVFVMSIRSGAVGIDLTKATDVVFSEPCLYNIEQQAIARAHRLGQRHAVTVHKYILENTVEEKMHALGPNFVSTNRQVISQLLQ